MLALLSPAKTLDYATILPTEKHSLPRLLQHSEQLIARCSQLSPSQIVSVMSVSDKIAQLNVERFRDWQSDFNLGNARQAIYAFKGDVYTGLNAYHLQQNHIEYAQQHLRILSGLYGLLRPLDLMMPYRLEMGTKLDNARGSNLYEFWGDVITQQINKDVQHAGSQYVLNLASDEYFKAVQTKKLQGQLIKVVFLDQKNDRYKVISFYAKKARGLMARYMLEQQIDQPEGLKDFNVDGYYFDAANSNSSELVFKRDEMTA